MFNMKGRARLEIELPSGITLVYDHESADGKAVPRWELMARMRAAIAATDFAAVQALYGEKPLVLTKTEKAGGEAGFAQLGGDAARPKPTPVKKPTPLPGNVPVGGVLNNQAQGQTPTPTG